MRKGIIFNIDGILIDAMPFHAEAKKLSIKEETNEIIDKNLLEGLPGFKLVKGILRREEINNNLDDSSEARCKQ